MAITYNNIIKYKTNVLSALLILVSLFCYLPAHCQLDYSYGKNNSGIRIGVGAGLSTLLTHFNKNPLKPVYMGSLDYDINPYLSFGFEGQYGTLQGIDDVNHLQYASSTNKYKAANFNIKVALGQFDDFDSKNAFQDALKRIYLGAGAGVIKNNITLEPGNNPAAIPYGEPELHGHYLTLLGNLGTNIDLPGVLGSDRLTINPNYQVTYINSLYSDGFISSQYSHLKGFYNLMSIKLKYKF